MNYNNNTRKKISRMIIDKNEELKTDYDNLKYRLDDIAVKICSEEEKDAKARDLLKDYIDNYTNAYDEIKWIDNYMLNEKQSHVLSFLPRRKINIVKYMPHWNEYIGGNKCGKEKDIPMEFEDVSKIWEPFYEYYDSMPKDNVKNNDMWTKSPNSIRVSNSNDAIPNPPSVKDLSNFIRYQEKKLMIVDNKEFMVLKEVIKNIKDLNKLYNENGVFKKRVLKGTGKDSARDFAKIYGKNANIISVPNNFSIITDYSKSFSFSNEMTTTKENQTNTDLQKNLNSSFVKNDYIIFMSDDEKAFAVLKVDYNNMGSWDEWYQPKSKEGESTIPGYYIYHFYIRFGFSTETIVGNGTMRAVEDTNSKIKVIINYYLNSMIDGLKRAQKSYENSNANIKTTNGNPEKNYPLFISYIENYKKELSATNNETEVVKIIQKIINTINSTISKWLIDRVSFLNGAIKDEMIPDGIKSILTDRMDKNTGSLFSWYSQDIIPAANEYVKNKQKIKNSLFLFKSGFFVSPDAKLDYTQKENGGKSLENPTFIDIPENPYKYYKMAGINETFKPGDTIYFLDDYSPETECKITSISKWKAVVGFETNANGDQEKVEDFVYRINIDKSIPKNISYSSLRIVKKI